MFYRKKTLVAFSNIDNKTGEKIKIKITFRSRKSFRKTITFKIKCGHMTDLSFQKKKVCTREVTERTFHVVFLVKRIKY